MSENDQIIQRLEAMEVRLSQPGVDEEPSASVPRNKHASGAQHLNRTGKDKLESQIIAATENILTAVSKFDC